MNVYDILNLLGGIALFLFGMHTLRAVPAVHQAA